VPEWASTHPNPVERVTRAATNARQLAVSGGIRNRDTFMTKLDGIMYGDDPKQGVIQGNSFLHPDLKLQFSVPSGSTMQNGTRAVTISGSSGQGQFTTGAYNGNMTTYIASAFQALAGEGQTIPSRSEERRVGKEERAWVVGDQ